MSDRFPHVREPSSGEPDICIYCREEWVDLLTLYERDECSVRLRAEVERLRAEASYLRACAPPVHPSDYGHEVWSAALRDAEARGWQGMRAEAAEWARLLVETKKDGARSTVAERATEREAVVAWIRRVATDASWWGAHGGVYDGLADAIESGEHRREEKP